MGERAVCRIDQSVCHPQNPDRCPSDESTRRGHGRPMVRSAIGRSRSIGWLYKPTKSDLAGTMRHCEISWGTHTGFGGMKRRARRAYIHIYGSLWRRTTERACELCSARAARRHRRRLSREPVAKSVSLSSRPPVASCRWAPMLSECNCASVLIDLQIGRHYRRCFTPLRPTKKRRAAPRS